MTMLYIRDETFPTMLPAPGILLSCTRRGLTLLAPEMREVHAAIPKKHHISISEF